MLRSPRDLHFVFATFGARQSLRNLVPLLALLGTALATLGRSRALLAGYVQALQVRYQGAPKAVRNYVEIVGLQKLLGLRPVRRVGIFFLEAISPWWSRSQNHRIFLFQTFPGTQSGESGMFPYHFVEMVLGWRASFPFPNSKLVAVRKFKKSEKGRCHKRDHKRAVPKFKKVYLTKKLPGKNYPWCKVFRPEKPCRKNYPTCKLFLLFEFGDGSFVVSFADRRLRREPPLRQDPLKRDIFFPESGTLKTLDLGIWTLFFLAFVLGYREIAQLRANAHHMVGINFRQ